jgi:antitoxin ParD1/3/4
MVSKAKSLHVTLPSRLRKFVDQQVKKEGYSTNSDYVQYLIRKEIKLNEQKKIERMLLEGIASGKNDKEWVELRDELMNKYGK